MHLAEHGRQHAVARHGIEDARLAQQQHQHHGAQAEHGADIDERHQPGQAGPIAFTATATGCGTFRVVYLAMPVITMHISIYSTVQMSQRAQNADRHVALRIAGFLRRHRNGSRSRYRRRTSRPRRAGCRSSRTGRSVPVLGGMKGVRLAAVTWLTAENDHQQHDDQLEQHHDAVEGGRSADADHQQGGEEQRSGRRPAD